MAFFDWNHDGEIDFADDFLEYNIFCACTESEVEVLPEIWTDEDEDEDENEDEEW